MVLFDTIKKDRAKMKGKSFKEKASYFAEYYKWQVIILAVLVVWIGGTVYQKATAPEIRMTGVLFNTSDLLTEEKIQGIIDVFSREQGLDSEKETILLHTNLTYFEGDGFASSNYESIQILTAWILTGDVDFIIADEALMNQLAEGGYLLELPDEFGDWEPVSSYLLDVSNSEILRSIYGNLSDTLTLGVAISTQNTERVLAFIEYLKP